MRVGRKSRGERSKRREARRPSSPPDFGSGSLDSSLEAIKIDFLHPKPRSIDLVDTSEALFPGWSQDASSFPRFSNLRLPFSSSARVFARRREKKNNEGSWT